MQQAAWALRSNRKVFSACALHISRRTDPASWKRSSSKSKQTRRRRAVLVGGAFGMALAGTCITVGTFFRADEDQDELNERLLEYGTHDPSLPEPGTLLQADYRRPNLKGSSSHTSSDTIRVVQWNIERGYKLDDVISELRELNADILLLQEIDVGCDRSKNRDTGAEIAEALGLNYAFLCEFIEYRSKARDAASQGGGVHGNAIMSRYDFEELEKIEHAYHPVDWNDGNHGLSRREPRVGRRLTLAARVASPAGPLQLYSAHLEVFCGPLGRLKQFADILRHTRACAEQGVEKQIIGGDLNTMGHGVARLSPFHCTDRLRWASMGQDEAHWWQRHLFDVHEGDVDVVDGKNMRLWRAGLKDESACADLVNPGFQEVFALDDVTLDNPQFRLFGISLMEGKLDWLLHRGLRGVSSATLGNHNYAASDHKWLSADLVISGKDSSSSFPQDAQASSPEIPTALAPGLGSQGGLARSDPSLALSPSSDTTSNASFDALSPRRRLVACPSANAIDEQRLLDKECQSAAR